MSKKYIHGVSHHPDYEYEFWIVNLKNNLFHKVCTVFQNMKATTENLADMRALIDCLEYEYLQKRRILDEWDSFQKEVEDGR